MIRKSCRERLDRTLVARGLVESREQAGRLILAGAVRVNGQRIDKQARLVPSDARIEVAGRPSFVSRGGEKLAAALDTFDLNPCGLAAMDVGASTGGFTDCLLRRGARRVYAVDVGYGQLDWRLRQDPRVIALERRNIRHLDPTEIGEPIGFAVIDVSFISLAIVLPCVVRFLAYPAWMVALIKPQFEVGRGQVGRGGVVRDDSLRRAAAQNIIRCASALGLSCIGMLDSPVIGQKGNREVLAAFQISEAHTMEGRKAGGS
jgi:23S rRNA (cytidine1920-2'-O)/16S rRNA (cytidine1409-2'-O)-methyltransferase